MLWLQGFSNTSRILAYYEICTKMKLLRRKPGLCVGISNILKLGIEHIWIYICFVFIKYLRCNFEISIKFWGSCSGQQEPNLKTAEQDHSHGHYKLWKRMILNHIASMNLSFLICKMKTLISAYFMDFLWRSLVLAKHKALLVRLE